jgi:hypothetical protein
MVWVHSQLSTRQDLNLVCASNGYSRAPLTHRGAGDAECACRIGRTAEMGNNVCCLHGQYCQVVTDTYQAKTARQTSRTSGVVDPYQVTGVH